MVVATNMRRRELIDPDLNAFYIRMCKIDVETSGKLFGEDYFVQ